MELIIGIIMLAEVLIGACFQLIWFVITLPFKLLWGLFTLAACGFEAFDDLTPKTKGTILGIVVLLAIVGLAALSKL